MASKLSSGDIDKILEQKDVNLAPYIQILGVRALSQNRMRMVIWDGRTVNQHCIVITEEPEDSFEKFSVVRFDEYVLSSLPKKENVQVILVNKFTIVSKGNAVNRKLGEDETWAIKDENRSMNTTSSSTTTSSNYSSRAETTTTGSNAPMSRSEPKANVPPASDGRLKNEVVSPITVLSPFYSNWVIRARVTNKGQLRTYNNAKGAGKLFSFDVCDETGEIRITCFNAEVDRFHEMIEKGKIYLISKGSVKAANKKFSSLNNDYEISLGSNSMMELVEDMSACSAVPSMRFKFVPISNINQLDTGVSIDVAGVLRSVGNIETIISKKTNKELVKREVAIVDKSNHEVKLTMWGDQATQFNGGVGQVICVKSAQVGDFRGKTLSTMNSSAVEIDLEHIPEVSLLRNWWNSQGQTENFTSLSTEATASGNTTANKFIGQLTPQSINSHTSPTLFANLHATVMATNRSNNHLYKSCGNNGCMKKVSESSEGIYFCSKCDRSSPNFDWRFMLSLDVADATGNCWVTFFQDQAEQLVGMDTHSLANLYETNQEEYTNQVNQVRFKKLNLRIGARIEEYNNERRVRMNGYTAVPTTPSDRINKLATFIESAAQQLTA